MIFIQNCKVKSDTSQGVSKFLAKAIFTLELDEVQVGEKAKAIAVYGESCDDKQAMQHHRRRLFSLILGLRLPNFQ